MLSDDVQHFVEEICRISRILNDHAVKYPVLSDVSFPDRIRNMFAKPSAEHGFFTPMIGQWTMENHCEGESGQTKVIATGRVSIRSLAGMWFIIETSGDGNEHHPEPWSSQITVGYDPQKKAYVGIFVGSMMTHLWIYEGQLDESKPCVSLYVEGPRCEGTEMAQYRDSIEIVSDDHWILRSEIQNDDGSWKQFMIGHHHRVK